MKKINKFKRILLWTGILLAAGFLLLNLLAYNHAYSMTHFTETGSRTGKPEELSFIGKAKVLFTGIRVPRPESSLPPSDLDEKTEVIKIKIEDTTTLEGWLVDAGAGSPVVCLFHGYAAEKTSLLPQAKQFLESGCTVLMIDFRGSGNSTGSATTIGFLESVDVARTFESVKTRFPGRPLILYGQSMGAAAVLRAVDKENIQPDGMILESVFDTMLNTTRNRFDTMGIPSFPFAELLVFWGGVQWKFNGFKHNPVTYAESVNCPALFLHGEKDPRVKSPEGRAVYENVQSESLWEVFPEAGHESLILSSPELWEDSVTRFMKQWSRRP